MSTPRLAAVEAASGLVANVFANLERLAGDAARDVRAVVREAEASYSGARRAVPRLARIVGEITGLAARYRLHAAMAKRLPARVASALRAELDDDGATRMHALCVELRGGLLKVGQFASCRVDLLPSAYLEQLGRLQDAVPAVPVADITARIEAELGRPLDQLFLSFEPEPIAAASLAQVHGAVLPDGSDVVVKVQVPGVDELVETDLSALQVLTTTLGDLFRGIDHATITAELARSVRVELDYLAEAKHAAAMGRAFAGHPSITVPRVHQELSSSRVLTMERLRGARLPKYLESAEKSQRDRLLEILLDATCAQVLTHGVFQADPHPGNFLVLPGPRLGMLDFGCVQRVSAPMRRAYAQLCGAVLARDRVGMANLLSTLGFRTLSGDSTALCDFADVLLEGFREGVSLDSLADPQVQLARALAIARANPVVQVPEEFVLLGRVFGALGGLILRYRPAIDLFRIVAPHLANALSANPNEQHQCT